MWRQPHTNVVRAYAKNIAYIIIKHCLYIAHFCTAVMTSLGLLTIAVCSIIGMTRIDLQKYALSVSVDDNYAPSGGTFAEFSPTFVVV